MCKECGCGHDREHHHHDDHQHTEQVGIPILDDNSRLAERNRGFFEAKNIWVVNVLSSPGSGKTTLLRETAIRLKGTLRVGIIVGDLATENDAVRLREAGIPVIQITTGTMCHLDATMIAKAARELPLDELDVLVIENVGNLVCPADFDLGENARIVLLSTTEGEDKPLKYPPMFHSADIAVITKTDLAQAAGFDRQQALANLSRIAHHAHVIELSAKSGEGMDEWCHELVHRWQHHTGHDHNHGE